MEIVTIHAEAEDRWLDHWLLKSDDGLKPVDVDRPLSMQKSVALAAAIDYLNERDYPDRRVDLPDDTHFYRRGYVVAQ